MSSLLDVFAKTVTDHPDRIAIIDGNGVEMSFEALQKRANGFASYWQACGVRKGDKVLVAMGVKADLYAALAALWSIGATVVLPEPSLGLRGLIHASKVTDVKFICASGSYKLIKYTHPKLWRLRLLRLIDRSSLPLKKITLDAADTALISFTSGTTGDPKGIARSHGFLMAQFQAVSPILKSQLHERDLVTFPVFVLINIANAQTSVLPNWKMRKLDLLSPESLASFLEARGVTRALLPPSLCEKLTHVKRPKTLKTVFTGGGPVFPNIVKDLQVKDLRVVCVYGSTEAEPIAHLEASEIDQNDQKAMLAGHGLLVGAPVKGIEVRIQDDEIQVSGNHVNSGYLNPLHDRENKIHVGKKIWHRTGDAGNFDESGRLWLLGRIGTCVQIEKEAFYPFAVEVLVRSWKGVSQCALIESGSKPLLIIQGEQAYIQIWQECIKKIGDIKIKTVQKIPMDRRHASKVDRKRLRKLLL